MKLHRSFDSALRAYRRAEARLNRFLRYLHRLAVAGACPGDLFIGWDRPTLRACRPADFARLVALEADVARERSQVRWFCVVQPLPLEFS